MKARLPKGMGGGPQNMNAMIRQAQKMQEDMEAMQADLDAREYEISAGGGVIGVKINGKREILSIDIKPEVVDPDDIETLSDIIQVGYFKLSHGKRVFKMAPFHHHLEMGGWLGHKWKEKEIFALFTAVSLIFAVLSYFGCMDRYAF